MLPLVFYRPSGTISHSIYKRILMKKSIINMSSSLFLTLLSSNVISGEDRASLNNPTPLDDTFSDFITEPTSFTVYELPNLNNKGLDDHSRLRRSVMGSSPCDDEDVWREPTDEELKSQSGEDNREFIIQLEPSDASTEAALSLFQNGDGNNYWYTTDGLSERSIYIDSNNTIQNVGRLANNELSDKVLLDGEVNLSIISPPPELLVDKDAQPTNVYAEALLLDVTSALESHKDSIKKVNVTVLGTENAQVEAYLGLVEVLKASTNKNVEVSVTLKEFLTRNVVKEGEEVSHIYRDNAWIEDPVQVFENELNAQRFTWNQENNRFVENQSTQEWTTELNRILNRDSTSKEDKFRLIKVFLETSDLQLKSSLSVLTSANLSLDFFAAAEDLYQKHNLDHAWVPVFENIEKTPSGQYRISLMHLQDRREISVVTSDDRIWKFKKYYEGELDKLKKTYNFSGGELSLNEGITDVEHVDGLNAGIAVQTILTWFNNRSRSAAAGDSLPQGLHTALKVHSYINLTQIAHGSVMDARKIAALYRAALGDVQSVTSATLSKVGEAANEALSIGLGIASVVFDSYELAHAQNELQKAVFGTQLTFDSASLVSTAAGLGAGLMGAGTASAVLGSGGVILGGLAIGFTALAQAFGEVADDAKAVGRYFAAVDSAYNSGGYSLVDKNLDGSQYLVLEPKDGAVFRGIYLLKGRVAFDSQYIYRTHHGKTGSGKQNYFFWASDMPSMVKSKSEAINVREGIGYDRFANINPDSRAALILPATPKSYISYIYQALAGATTRHDSGFSVIRRLEQDKRFDFDFYIFPFEQIIQRITQEYVYTEIKVRMDSQDRHILMRKLGKELSGKLHYNLFGRDGEYVIGLQSGASLSLDANKQKFNTRWILDARQLLSDDLIVRPDQLSIGGVIVKLPKFVGPVRIAVINKDNGVMIVNPRDSSYKILSVDASRLQDEATLHQHIQSEVNEHHIESAFVAIDNFKPQGQDYSVGRAYYQVDEQRFIYTPSPSHSDFLSDVKLVDVKGDLAWFNKGNQVWLVDIAESRIVAQYRGFDWDYANGVAKSHLRQENNSLYWSVEQQTDSGHTATWTYVLDENSMKLVDVNGDFKLLDNLMADTAPYQSSTNDFFPYYPNGIGSAIDLKAERWIDASLSEVISVSATKEEQKHRYWVLTEQSGELGVIKANLSSQPDDLILAFVKNKGETDQSNFFYSHSQQVLYHQKSNGSGIILISLPEFSGGLREVLNEQNHLFVIANDQTLWLADQTARLAGVTSHWLQNNRQQVLSQLKDLNEKQFDKLAQLVLLGITDSQGQAVNLWYDNKSATLIRAGSNLNGQHLSLLGLTSDQKWAWVYNKDDASLYRQAVVTIDLTLDENLVLQDDVADAELFTTLEGELTKAALVGQSLQLSTRDGLVVELSVNAAPEDKPILRAVTKEWQSNHDNLNQAFDVLESEYQLPKPVRLLGSVPGWYLYESGRTVSVAGLNANHGLTYLGQSVDGGDYVFDIDAQTLYLQTLTGLSTLGDFSMALTEGGSNIILQGSGGNNVHTLPRVKEVRSLLWSGHGNDYQYTVEAKDLAHYQQVLIQSRGIDQTLELALENPNALLLLRRGEDLALYDPESQTSILIQQVDTAAQTNKMKLRTALGEMHLESIILKMDLLLSATPNEIITYGMLQEGEIVPVAIENASFDNTDIPENTLVRDVPGWTLSGYNTAIVREASSLSAVDGGNFMQISWSDSSINQELNETFDTAADYQLAMDFANSKYRDSVSGFEIRLWAGDTLLGNAALSYNQARDRLGYGRWNTLTLNLDGRSHQDASGENLKIEVLNTGTEQHDRVNVDNIRLETLTGSMAIFSDNAYTIKPLSE